MSEVILLHSSKSTRGGYSGVNASHTGDNGWKSTNDRNRILGAAAFMEASGRVGKDEHRIDGVTEGYQRKLS